MVSNSGTLTRGNLWSGIFRVSLPLILSNVLQVLFNMSDIAVVGRFAGAAALGSVGSTAILVMLYTGVLIGIGGAINIVTARCLGAGENDKTVRCVHACALTALGSGIAVMLLGLLASKPVLQLLGTKSDLMEGACLYISVYSLGYPAMGVFNYGNAIFGAQGDTKKPFYVLLCAGILNVGLNIFFVVCCHMDVAGVALASIISQYLAAAVITILLTRSKSVCRMKLRAVRPDKYYTKEVLTLGLPAAFQNSVFAIANLFVQAGVNQFSSVVVEGYAAAANADNLIYDIMTACYMAGGSFMSQNFGAGNKKRLLHSYFISTFYAFAFALVLGAALYFFGDRFLSLFTSDSAVVEAGMVKLRIIAFSYCITAFMDGSIDAARSIGKTLVPTIIVIMGSCVFRVVWVYTVFAYFHTIESLYMLFICSWVLTSIAEILYFRKAYKEQTRAFCE